jgi:hypothetical protein
MDLTPERSGRRRRPPGSPCRLGSWRVTTSPWMSSPAWCIGFGRGHDARDWLDHFRKEALEGAKYCRNDGCQVVGKLKDIKVCRQCKTARYCGDACQKQDWTTGGHKATCGTPIHKIESGGGRAAHP